MALSCPVLLCPYQDDLMPKSLMLVFLVTIFVNNLLRFGTSQPHSTLLPFTLSPNSASALVGLIPWQISTNNNIFSKGLKVLATDLLCHRRHKLRQKILKRYKIKKRLYKIIKFLGVLNKINL